MIQRPPSFVAKAPRRAAILMALVLANGGVAAAQTEPAEATPAGTQAAGPVVLLADPTIRAEVAQALAVELAPLRLAVVQSDPPVGETPLARAASAQATAVATGAQAAVWLEPSGAGVIVRTVLADGIQMDEVAVTTPSPRAIAVVAVGQLEDRLIPGAEPPPEPASASSARVRIQVPQVSGDPILVEAELSMAPSAPAPATTPSPAPAPPTPSSPPPAQIAAPEAPRGGPHFFGWIGGSGMMAHSAQLTWGAGGQAGFGVDPIPELRIALAGTVGWTTGTPAFFGSQNVISTLGAAEIGPRFRLGDVYLTASARFGVWVSEDTGGASLGPTGGVSLSLEIPVVDLLAVVLRAQSDIVLLASNPQRRSEVFLELTSLMIGLQVG